MLEIVFGYEMTPKMLWRYGDLALVTNDKPETLIDESIDFP